MAVEKISFPDKIEILANGCIQIRTKTVISEDAEEIATKFFRKVITPGDDYTQEPEEVRQICQIVHTNQKIEEYRNSSSLGAVR